MTAAQIITRTRQRLDVAGASTGYWEDAEILVALNEAQRLWVLMTLCLEKRAVFGVGSGLSFYRLLPLLPDFLLPLRVRVAISNGTKLRPGRIQDFDARNPEWMAEPGDPLRYTCLGFDLFAIWPRPDGNTNLDITYAHCPAAIADGTGTPEIPVEDHPCLIDFMIPLLRTKEGGQEFGKSLVLLDRYFEAAKRRAQYVRARSLAQRYDRVPFEIDAMDRSKLIDVAMKRAKPIELELAQEKK